MKYTAEVTISTVQFEAQDKDYAREQVMEWFRQAMLGIDNKVFNSLIEVEIFDVEDID